MATSNSILATQQIERSNWLSRLIHVPQAIGDDARRRRLLNMVLLAVFVLSALLVLVAAIPLTISSQTPEEASALQLQVVSSFAMMVISSGLWLVNRYISGMIAGWLLVVLLTAAIAFADAPTELTEGRSTFFFALPIMIAAVALRPRSTFIASAIASVAIVGLTAIVVNENGQELGAVLTSANYAAIAGFFIIALLSWLASSSLESALAELRVINTELDRRVAERTQELSVALTTVQAVSSKNEAILQSIADGVVVFGKDNLAESVNPAMTRLLDCPDDKILGSTISEITQGEMESKSKDDTLPNNRRIQINDRTLSISLAHVQAEGGQSGEIVGVFRDFTREAQVEKMKDAFVSMASHELRTPLNAILGYADMLRHGADGDLNEAQRKPH